MKTAKLIGIFALAFAMAACGGGSGDITETDITYTASQTGGSANTADSTGISFTFSATIDGLGVTANDITVSGAAAKGAAAAFSGSGARRTLSPITVSSAGTATVRINKAGIISTTVNVTVYKAPPPQTPVPVPDVNFPATSSLQNQSEASAAIKTAVDDLAEQCRVLWRQFDSVNPQTAFTERASSMQSQIGRRYQVGDNVLGIKQSVVSLFNILYNQIAGLYDDPAAAELFKARMHAFQTASYFGQRDYYRNNDQVTAEENFVNACAEVTRLGGGQIPTGNVPRAVSALRQALEESMPAGCEFAEGILQQAEDYGEFDGFTDALRACGSDMSVIRSMQP
jgi:hypothetical protein